MLSDIDIHPPLQLSPWRSVIAFLLVFVVIAGYYLWLLATRMLAIRRQKALAKHAKPNFDTVINDALKQIETIRQQVSSQQMSPHDAAEQLSAVVRSTFDTTMNHRTRYQAKYEIAERRLDHILEILEISYPIEFSAEKGVLDTLTKLCDTSKQVVESCR